MLTKVCPPQVSHTRRTVGAVFVEELGAGAGFSQTDLHHTECYLLDSGRRELYLWYGRESSWHGRALCLRVAKAYLSALQRPHDPSASSILQQAFTLPAAPLPALREIESGQEETGSFMEAFRVWVPVEKAGVPSRLCVVWNAAAVSEEDTEDSFIGNDGRRREENVREGDMAAHNWESSYTLIAMHSLPMRRNRNNLFYSV